MNKKILAAGVSVVVLVGAHTAFWFNQSGKIKAAVEQMAGQISKEFGNKTAEFAYSNSKISGYPFNFTINLSEPKFTSTGGGEKLELASSEDQLVIKSNLIGSSYKIKLPSKVNIKKTIDDKEKNYKLEFANSSPQIDLKFAKNILFSAKTDAELIQYLSENVKSLNYNDAGYLLTNSEDNAKLASSDADTLQVVKNKSKPNNIATAYNIKVQNLDHSALYTQTEEGSNPVQDQTALWPISAKLEMLSNDVRDESGKSSSVDFMLKDLNIAAATFGIAMKGDVKANSEDIFPFGDLNIKVSGYQNMVDYFSGTVSNALAQSKIPLFQIKSEKSIDFKKVLAEIATEKSNEDKDILLNISRKKGESLYIGQKGLMEVVDLLKASASVNTSAPKKDANAPQMPLLDTAPAAGIPLESPKAK